MLTIACPEEAAATLYQKAQPHEKPTDPLVSLDTHNRLYFVPSSEFMILYAYF